MVWSSVAEPTLCKGVRIMVKEDGLAQGRYSLYLCEDGDEAVSYLCLGCGRRYFVFEGTNPVLPGERGPLAGCPGCLLPGGLREG